MEGRRTRNDVRGPVTLVSLPMELIESVLSYLSYDEISNKRVVCRKFNMCCKNLLNQGFIRVERFHAKCLKQVKKQLPRRESERRSHPLSRHCEVLTSIETRLSLLGMTFTKYMDLSLCCFIPGKVIDEIYRVLRLLQKAETPPRTHEVLQELRDISSMAMEHFDERIAPGLKLHMPSTPRQSFLASGLLCSNPSSASFSAQFVSSRYQNRCPPSAGCSHGGMQEEINQLKATCAALLRCNADSKQKLNSQFRKTREQDRNLREQQKSIREQARLLSEQQRALSEQARIISEQATRLAEQEGKLGETNRKLSEQHKQLVEAVAGIQNSVDLVSGNGTGRKRTAAAAQMADDDPLRRKTRSMQQRSAPQAVAIPETAEVKAPANRPAGQRIVRQRKA